MWVRVGAALLGWIAFGSLVEAHRSVKVQDDPVLVAVVEADLASRACPDLTNDVDQVRRVAAEQQTNHADFFTRKRSAGLTTHLADLRQQLRDAPGPTCERMWMAYGAGGWRLQLLKRS